MASAHQSTSDEIEIDISHLQIEDDEPVDNTFSEKQMRLLTESLYSSWQTGEEQPRPFAAFANVGLFYALNEQPIVPDVMVSLDVRSLPDPTDKRTLSYFIWEYGKPPDIVIEVVSNKEGGEATTKLSRYASVGVAYYAIFDPFGKLSRRSLRVFARTGKDFIELVDPSELPGLGLGLVLWEGAYEGLPARWLRWVDESKRLISTGAEGAQEARLAAQEALLAAQEALLAAQEARLAAQEAREAAQQAQDRAERLAAKLRELGVEPNRE